MPLLAVSWPAWIRANPSAASETTPTDSGSHSNASEPSEDEDNDVDIETVTVETTVDEAESVDDPRYPSGWATRLETSKQFGKGRDLSDSLERVSGLSIRRQSSLGQPSFAHVRGGNPRQLTVRLNGIRLGAPAGVGFDLSSVSTSWIDEMTVYRGAAASIFGSGALAGTLALETASPRGDGWNASGTAMAGSFGTIGGAAEAKLASAHAGVTLDASWRGAEGDFTFIDDQGQSHTRLNNSHNRLVTHGTGGVEIDDHELTGTVVVERGTRGAPGPSEYQQQYRRAHVHRRRLIATTGWKRRNLVSGSWGAIDGRVDAGYVDRRRQYDNSEPFVGSEPVDTTADHRSFVLRARGDLFLAFGNIAHLTLEGRFDTFDANYQWRGESELSTDRTTLAAGLSDEWLLFDEALSIIGGLRAEMIRDRDATRVPLIPSAGLIWRALPWLTAKGNVARTHRVPDFDELYLRTETIRGNPDLEPERALQWDLGLEIEGDDWPLGGRIAFFQSDIRETILFLPETAYLYRAQNLEGATSLGLETALRAQPLDSLDLRVSYTWTRAHLDATPGVQLPHRPEHRAHLRGSLELAAWPPFDSLESLQLTATGQFRSRVNLGNFGRLTNPAFGTLDLGLSVAPSPWMTWGIDVHNITDHRRGADSLQRPLPGRAIYASMSLQYGTLSKVD